MDFKSLYQDSKLLYSKFSTEAPFLFRSLEEIEQQSLKLVKRASKTKNSKATAFLATHGVDAEISDAIHSIKLETSEIEKLDLESRFDAEHDAAFANLFDKCLDNFSKTSQLRCKKLLQTRWNSKKTAKISSSRPIASVIAKPTTVSHYLPVVKELNDFRMHNSEYDLVGKFKEACSLLGNQKYQQIVDCWELVQHHQKKNVIEASKSFLQDQYYKFIKKTVSQFPREAMLGGRPSNTETVKAFLNIKFGRLERQSLELVNGIPIWAHLYYLLRCGFHKDAFDLASQYDTFLYKVDPLFLKYITLFSNSEPFPQELVNRIRANYSQMYGNDDWFKIALFKLFGRCELNKKSIPQVIKSTEDYLWFQLELLGDDYSLNDFQDMIIKYGPKHFDPRGSNPIHYFQILLVCGLFEEAISFLCTTPHFSEAVHFGIALVYSKKLRVGKDLNVLEIASMESNSLVINYWQLLHFYYYQSNLTVQESFPYILSISVCDNCKDKCIEEICNSILDSRDYAFFLGEEDVSGLRSKGALHLAAKVLDRQSDFVGNVVAKAARLFQERNQLQESLKLYNLVKEYSKALSLLCVMLNEIMSGPFIQSHSESVLQEAKSIITYYNSKSEISGKIPQQLRETCYTCFKLAEFTVAFHREQYEAAFQILIAVDIFPLSGGMAQISQYAEKFSLIDDSIRKHGGELLVNTFKCLTKLHKSTLELQKFIGLIQIPREFVLKIHKLSLEK